MGITSEYVDFCLSLKYEDLPSEVIEYVKRLGLDELLPEKFPARAVISTIDGRKFEKMIERPHGDGLEPMAELLFLS